MVSRLTQIARSGLSVWDRFWHREVLPHGLAAFRILFGVFLLAYIAPLLNRVELMYSSQGIYVPFLIPDIAPSPSLAVLIFVGFLSAIGLFISGFHTRVVTPVLLTLFTYHWCLNLAINNTAYDRLIVTLLAICCFAKLDGAWSVTSLRNPKPPQATIHVPGWPGRLIMVQLALLYFGSGLWKLSGSAWRTGEMLRMTMMGPWATPAAFWLVNLGLPDWLFDALAWTTVGFELIAGFALFVPRLRVPFMAVGAGFHLSIWLFLNIGEFMFCVATYVLFFQPEAVRDFVEKRLSIGADR